MQPFNVTLQTTFFGFPHTNVQLVFTKARIGNTIVGIQGDILFFNVSQCYLPPDRSWNVILFAASVAFLNLVSFLFQLSLFPAFCRLTKMRGPAFIILLNMLFCSSLSLLPVFVGYSEGAIGFPVPFISFYMNKFRWLCPNDGESIFQFLFSISRSAALMFPFIYSSTFNRKNILWMICLCWLYVVLKRAEYMLAHKGEYRMNCMGAGGIEGLNDAVAFYNVIMDPSMVALESLVRKVYYIVWYSPIVMDACTLAKLFNDKYRLQIGTWPWIVKRPAGAERIEEGRNERIRMFLICLICSAHHYVIGSGPAGTVLKLNTILVYNYSRLLENAMPYLLMLLISRDVRSQWWRTMRCCGRRGGGRIQPLVLLSSTNMYPPNSNQ